MRFHGIGHIHEHDSVASYIVHVEKRGPTIRMSRPAINCRN